MEIDDVVTYYLVKDTMPNQMVVKGGFKQMVKKIDLRYIILVLLARPFFFSLIMFNYFYFGAKNKAIKDKADAFLKTFLIGCQNWSSFILQNINEYHVVKMNC